MACQHDHVYELRGIGVHVRFCRIEDCTEWTIVASDVRTGDRSVSGVGLEDYRAALMQLAQDRPGWEGAAFLYDLGGHAIELETRRAE
jgi:hypothetical protein